MAWPEGDVTVALILTSPHELSDALGAASVTEVSGAVAFAAMPGSGRNCGGVVSVTVTL